MARAANDTPKLKPVIFLGLGSTGGKIVSRIREIISKDHADARMRRFYQYRIITSEVVPEPQTDTDIRRIVMASTQMPTRTAIENLLNSSDKSIREETEKWWHYEEEDEPWIPAIQTLDEGAGGCRSIGRILLHSVCTHRNLMDEFISIVKEINRSREELPPEEQGGIEKNSYECVVFGNLAGGTCNGILIDTAYLVKSALHAHGVKLSFRGAFLLGDICYHGASSSEIDPFMRRRQQNNTAYALAEMFLLQNEYSRKIIRPSWTGNIGSLKIEETVLDTRPYDTITFVGARNENNETLSDFQSYIEFMAHYYSDFYMSVSQATSQTVGRDVDSEGLASEEAPNRPNSFARIGRLNLAVPAEKIVELCKEAVCEDLAINYLKNSDEDRYEAALVRFENVIHWTSFEDQFYPTGDEPTVSVDEMGDLPDSEDEFRMYWEQKKRDIDSFYGSRCPLAPGSLGLQESDKSTGLRVIKENLAAFESLWRKETSEITREFAGQTGHGVNLGGLKSWARTVNGRLSAKSRGLDSLIADFESKLFARSGQTDTSQGLNSQFESLLQDLSDEFPEKSLVNPLVWARRQRWPGNAELADLLREYQKGLRDYVACKTAREALRPLLRTINGMDIVRKLISHYAAQPVIMEQRDTVSGIFDNTKRRHAAIARDVISGKQEILDIFVNRILEDPASPGADISRKELLCEAIMTGWHGTSQKGFWETWEELSEIVSEGNYENADIAITKDDRLQYAVRDLSNAFRLVLDQETTDKIEPIVREISVWEAIYRYVLKVKNGKKPEVVLGNMFRSFFEKAGFFTKLSHSAARDTVEKAKAPFYICNEEDAAECFGKLQIANPEAFLSGLLTKTLGHAPTPLPVSGFPKSKMMFFFTCRRDLPVYYEGFEHVAELLQKEPIEVGSGSYNWTDRRFPEWIRQWHDKYGTPAYLE